MSSKNDDTSETDGPFRDLLDNHHYWMTSQLNHHFVPKMLADPPTFNTSDAVSYLSNMRNCNRHYQFVPGCSLFGMGASDLNQFVVLDEDREDTYPLHKVKSLPVKLDGAIKDISMGGLGTYAVTAMGHVYSWGSADEGALGRPVVEEMDEVIPGRVTGFVTIDGEDEDGKIIQVCAGANHALFLSVTGNVYTCGGYKDNDHYFRDPPTQSASVIGINKKPVHVFGLKGKKIVQIATSSASSINAAVTDDGKLYTWGLGVNGDLARSKRMAEPDSNGNFDIGLDFYYTTKKAYSDGKSFKLVPTESIVRSKFMTPSLVCWDNTVSDENNIKVVSVACGYAHLLVCAADSGGDGDTRNITRLYSSGLALHGQTGHGDYKARHRLTLVDRCRNCCIDLVAAGASHSLAVTADGLTLLVFGQCNSGQLGIGRAYGKQERCVNTPVECELPLVTMPNRKQHPTIVHDVVCGENTSYVITSEKDVLSWGFGEMLATGHAVDEKFKNEDIYVPKMLKFPIEDNPDTYVHKIGAGPQATVMLVEEVFE